ncbi:MAG: hypothetical protein JWM15_2049, partial [Cryptosporangiaceae bacterium]|nr:hypothetical protein [Cryptosporangiaceae bacterium]
EPEAPDPNPGATEGAVGAIAQRDGVAEYPPVRHPLLTEQEQRGRVWDEVQRHVLNAGRRV